LGTGVFGGAAGRRAAGVCRGVRGPEREVVAVRSCGAGCFGGRSGAGGEACRRMRGAERGRSGVGGVFRGVDWVRAAGTLGSESGLVSAAFGSAVAGRHWVVPGPFSCLA